MYHTLAIVDFERRLSLGNSQGKLIEASSKPDGVLMSMFSLGNTAMNLLVCKKETSSWVDTYKKYTIVPCSMKTQYLKDNGTSVNTYKFIELEEEFSINSFTKITKYYYSQDGKNIVIFRSSPILNGAFVNGDIIINDETTYKTKQWIYKDGVWLDDNYNPYNAAISGSSSSRPSNINNGFFYFDTTLNKPIWWTGSKWVDATGADV